jgi:CRP/FNR family transcriptional regulator, cyclic AMP receptor protein
MIDHIKPVYLKSFALFKNLSENQLSYLVSLAKVKQFNAGDIINYGSGSFSKIYFIVSGKVKITEHGIEDELVKDVLTDGEMFGDLELEGNPKAFECGQALTENTVVCYLSSADFISVLQSYPHVAIIYAKSISMKLKRLEDRHSDLMQHDVRSRLVRFIKNWALADGNAIGDKIILNNYLTHSDIAGMISSSRQTVSVLFKELKDSGLLQYNRKLIQLNDFEHWKQAV